MMEDKVFREFNIPFLIHTFYDVDHYLAIYEPLGISGKGDSEWEAIRDLKYKIQRYFKDKNRKVRKDIEANDKELIKINLIKKIERITCAYARPSIEEIIDMVFEEIEREE